MQYYLVSEAWATALGPRVEEKCLFAEQKEMLTCKERGQKSMGTCRDSLIFCPGYYCC